ncbi:MAG: hypothetical protein WA790_14755 [Sulfitobacter sp.]
MRRLGKWLLRIVIAVVMLGVALLLPVAWVEFACRGDATGDEYEAILPPEYHRAEARTLLTYPEWHIVHAYDDYAQVIDDNDPHDFGYLRAIRTYWSSLCALKKQAASHGGMDIETKQLVYVIGVSFSVELVFKAAYEESIGRITTWVRGAEHSPLDVLSAEQAKAYATFLQQVPWYKWDFKGDIAALDMAKSQSLRDRERRFALGGEFAAKSAYAGVIEGAVANVGADELTLRMIVKGPDVQSLARHEGITIINERPEGIEIETIRYRALTKLLEQMAMLNVEIVEIAGNDDIMLTVISENPDMVGSLSSFQRQGYDDYRHLILVKVNDLLTNLAAFSNGSVRLEHVHDY